LSTAETALASDLTSPRQTDPSDRTQASGGELEADGRVNAVLSRKSMLELRWTIGQALATATVNPAFKFGDLDLATLQMAFTVDGLAMPGEYETIEPARIAWTQSGVSGKVTERGRARPRGR
jgi:hypothetical protein